MSKLRWIHRWLGCINHYRYTISMIYDMNCINIINLLWGIPNYGKLIGYDIIASADLWYLYHSYLGHKKCDFSLFRIFFITVSFFTYPIPLPVLSLSKYHFLLTKNAEYAKKWMWKRMKTFCLFFKVYFELSLFQQCSGFIVPINLIWIARAKVLLCGLI